MDKFGYWNVVEKLVEDSDIVINRPKGTRHHINTDVEYPADYGYLDEKFEEEMKIINVWKGTDPEEIIDAVICMIDPEKSDSEIKVLIGCTEEEKRLIRLFHSKVDNNDGVIIRRDMNKTNNN